MSKIVIKKSSLLNRDRLFPAILLPGIISAFSLGFLCACGQCLSLSKADIASVKASSYEKEEFSPQKATDGDYKSRWSSEFSDPQWLMVDLGQKKIVEKIVVHWEPAYARLYQIQASVDGNTWYVIQSVTKKIEGKDEISFNPIEARYLRVYGIERNTGWGYSIYEIEVFSSQSKPVALSNFKTLSEFRYKTSDLMPDAYYKITADLLPQGYYPLWIGSEQGYWTIAGTDDGYFESLISENGAVEVYPRSWSVIPYLYIDKKLITRADAEVTQSLEENYLPIPSVKWAYDALIFDQTFFVSKYNGEEITHLWYKLTNTGSKKLEGKLFFTFRPFQVTPSWQGEGGMSDLFSIDFREIEKNKIILNGNEPLYFLTQPLDYGAVSYLENDIMSFIEGGIIPAHKEDTYDHWGGATGAISYEFSLSAGQSTDILLYAPIEKRSLSSASLTAEDFSENLAKEVSFWKQKLNRIQIDTPNQYLEDVVKSNIAYLLINKDGSIIQPGSRHYERTWIRDGAGMGIALLRMGYQEEVRKYLDWVSKRQLFNGDVPCMMNTDGSMWDWGKTLPEYDGQGTFITAIAEYYKYTKDKKFLEEKFPHVVKALEFLQFLRNKRLTDEYKNGPPEKRIYYGILPNSVSHEGYPQPGVHSYWDDFWALKGWREAIDMAKILGREDLVPWMTAEEQDFRKCFYDAIDLAQKFYNIDFIPGCSDLGDFDATATAIGVWPTDEYKNVPLEEMELTLDKYYHETFLPRIRGEADPEAGYVPYEMRTISAYLVLGHKEKALAMLNHFLSVTRPRNWNHWAEVVYGNYRKPGYIGDMPHAWVGSDFLNAALSLFVLEIDDKIILGTGIEEKWLTEGKGVSIKDFCVYSGKISYDVKKENNTVKISLRGEAQPKDGFIFKSPLSKKIKKVTLDGKNWTAFTDNAISFHKLPAEIVIYFAE